MHLDDPGEDASLRVWAVTVNESLLSEDLYQKALLLVDPESQTRIKRFYFRPDAWRCLIGRVLPRMMLQQRGVPTGSMTFGATKEGKPYVVTDSTQPPIAFNVTHDNGIVAMVFGIGDRVHAPAYRVGIDVMKVALPKRTTFRDLVESVSSQLTSVEYEHLTQPNLDQATVLKHFFMIWTMKEAYTKALGLGLGFEFTRVDYNILGNTVRIDGREPVGWEFTTFDLPFTETSTTGAQETTLYVGVTARHCSTGPLVIRNDNSDPFVTRIQTEDLINSALQKLGSASGST